MLPAVAAANPTNARPGAGYAGAPGYWRIARHFAARELRERFLGSLSGAAWALFAPVLQLLVLLLVFGVILRVRLPDADPRAFLPFLVSGLWPWVAFSEAVLRGMGAIVERSALIAKVAVPRSALVLAPVLASFTLNGIGYLAVLLVIAAFGYPVDLAGILVVLPYWILLAVFAFGLALALATVRVFVPDAAHVVPQLVALWFYLTPIFYPLSIIPAALRGAVEANPMTALTSLFRHALVHEPVDIVPALGIAVLAAGLALALGSYMFRRASRHFEDFL